MPTCSAAVESLGNPGYKFNGGGRALHHCGTLGRQAGVVSALPLSLPKLERLLLAYVALMLCNECS
eukprot:980590-Pleurochrysis_carterae.AAC.1